MIGDLIVIAICVATRDPARALARGASWSHLKPSRRFSCPPPSTWFSPPY